MHKISLILLGTLLGTMLYADNYRGCSDGGCTEFHGTVNRHGLVLRSPRTTLYIGKSCDAYSKVYGKGRWEWANGGFVVQFPHKRFGFARQVPQMGIDISHCLMQ